jgi:hypothetical protein
VSARVERVQEVLKRRILIENVSTYLRFAGDAMSEAEFLAALARRTGCGILLDVNNLYVNQCNHGEDAIAALDALAGLAPGTIGELHLGGHLVTDLAVIDHHGDRIAAPVWDLYREALQRFGELPVLVEWDTDVPPLAVLLDEAAEAGRIAAEVLAGSVAEPRSATPRSPMPQPSAGINALDAVQQAFGAALADPAELAALAPQLKGDPARLGIYRGNLASARQRALASSHPVLRRLLGDERFDALARAYGCAQPARDPDLNRFGAGLAVFLEATPADAGQAWLPELARLEWMAHEAWYAPDAVDGKPLAVLASLDPQQFEASRAILHPSLGLFGSRWAVAALWRAHQAEPDDPAMAEDMREPDQVLILRARWQVTMRKPAAAEYAALARLAAGETFGAAFDAAFDIDEDAPIAAWLDGWLKEGLVTGIVKED